MDIIAFTRALHQSISAVCPIDGVSIGDVTDKSTWRVGFTLDATDAQKAAAQAALSSFVFTTPVPQTVSPRQARLALLGAGLLDQVNNLLNAAGGANLITWEYATQINRTDALIAALAGSLNLTAAQIDALFVAAAGL